MAAMDVLSHTLVADMDVLEWSEAADCDSKPKRKRQRLDHLSQEEKLMRRKLKNRMAAQSARDRKKVKMHDLEHEVIVLAKQRIALLNQNESLKKKNSLLEQQNQELKQRMSEMERQIASPATVKVEAGLEPSTDWTETFESAALINVSQQQKQVSSPATRTASLTAHLVFWSILQNLMLCSMFSLCILKNCSTQMKITAKGHNCRQSMAFNTNRNHSQNRRNHIWDQLKT